MKQQTTKSALLTSAMALLLCFAMLIGTTFAWFTDTASTAVNKIQSGKLDVALEMQKPDGSWESAEGKTLEWKTADNRAQTDILWEPDCTYELQPVRVKNNGNLALKYKIVISGIKGSAKLNNVIEWTINDAALESDHHLAAGAVSDALTIKGHMQESAGNEYMNEKIENIAITVYATLKETGTEMMPFNNIFNEWYAAQTSKKIRAVWKNKAANGKRVSSSVPFGYVRNPQDKEDWLVDEPAAEVVRKIYALCLDGRGPSQIARQLEQEKVLIPTAYYASLGRKTRKQYTNPYAWDQKTVAGILVNQQYTGCTVNFMTTTVSYKVHKTVHKPKDEWQIIPNTQPAIIDEDTWKRVQELREHRIRPTATGRTSLFSGKVFCADCGSKLHFCAAKSLNANQEHYRCSNYKSGRGSCQIHFIRNVVLEKIVLEAINSLADFVRCYEPVFLYLMAQKDIVSKRTETSKLKTAIESGKRRIQDLDKLIERIYEDQVLGNISAERYARMSVNYENEQRTLINKVAEDEKKLACIEQTSLDLKTLLKVLRSSTSFEELTPTLVNSLIRRIEVHNNDKSSGHCYVKVDIYFTAIGLIDIPTEDEIKSLMAKIKANPQEYRLTA